MLQKRNQNINLITVLREEISGLDGQRPKKNIVVNNKINSIISIAIKFKFRGHLTMALLRQALLKPALLRQDLLRMALPNHFRIFPQEVQATFRSQLRVALKPKLQLLHLVYSYQLSQFQFYQLVIFNQFCQLILFSQYCLQHLY